MPLSEEERVRCRAHCGYLNVADAYTFVLGSPASVETQFIIEGAMDRVKESALPECRRLLGILDNIEDQMVGDHELLAVTAIGEISINTKEQAALTQRYDYWVGALVNLLGIERNPFDKRVSARGINARVQ